MSSPWGKIVTPIETINFAEIMSEEYAHRVHDKEIKKYQKICETADSKKRAEEAAKKEDDAMASIWDDVPGTSSSNFATGAVSYSEATKLSSPVLETTDTDDEEWEDCTDLIKEAAKAAAIEGENLSSKYLELVQQDASDMEICDSDEVIALMLQSQFDHEYNKELQRIEQQQKQGKVSISLDNFKRTESQAFLSDSDEYDDEEDELASQKRDWDHFETNAKKLETIPKCGFKMDKSGEMITKHDAQLCGVRNACRVMSFPPEFPTGDGASFEMKLSNQVFNQLKTYSRRGNSGVNVKKNKLSDRRENVATAEMGIDERTRLILYKLINNQILEQINGIISTGKEAVILHANSDPHYSVKEESGEGEIFCSLLPKECAIKIFKTTLNEFKQRDRYIKDDYRFKDRFSKQNKRCIINMWAEKEMHNMMRMKSFGINCPEVVVLKRHVLIMSFIGDNHNAAPKLKDAQLSSSELRSAYKEIIESMYKLYNEVKLVHADLSEYNILWHDGKCWFIDVAQSVEPEHPSALEFLMRDCGNIITFFTKRGLSDIYTKEQLFEHITALDAETHNVAMLERIHFRGATLKEATDPNQEECPDELKPLSYPFDLAWEKSQSDKLKQKTQKTLIDNTAAAFEVLSVRSCVQDEASENNSTDANAVDSAAKN